MSVRRGITCAGRGEGGYILLTLLLVLALLAIAATAIAPGIVFQIKRDREEELVHRGIQYRRAVRLYVTKTGRYPVTPDALLGTADARYIRKLYKDPITGGEFRWLHMGDVQPGVGLGAPAQASQSSGTNDSNQTPDVNAFSEANSPPAAQATAMLNGQQTNSATATAVAQLANTPSGPQPGLLIFGVASRSKDRTIREFNKKNHYNDWWFFYDPRASNGYEVKGPTPPAPVITNPITPPASVANTSASTGGQGSMAASPQ